MGGSEQSKTACTAPSTTGAKRSSRAANFHGRRGHGKPFEKGDARINRKGVPHEAAALAKLLRDRAAEVLLSPSPRFANMDGEAKSRLICILEKLADKAERGDVRAAEILFERIGGKPTQPIEMDTERGHFVIEWGGPPPPWAPQRILDDYAASAKRNKKALPAPPLGVAKAIEAEIVAEPPVLNHGEASHNDNITDLTIVPPAPAAPPANFAYSRMHPTQLDKAALAWARGGR